MVKAMVKELEDYNLIIVNTDTIHEVSANIISNISKDNKVILNYMGISKIPFEEIINLSCQSILYSQNQYLNDLNYSGQIIFGGLSCYNKLKDSLSTTYPKSFGLKTKKLGCHT